ncbi:hypothetical protein [Oceanobacillus kimchii]|uniref:Uncharacterized protein n=1 Tax=Oceanobacillus kimchii TaxID=746691 RepID=A0ABQ5TI70_9BACI|nr:hypothetical protein [Oceanobacillus kimchii]GLO66155.1 hypothetical protein MACH08_19390 [Oceanobacillus kimchii]
MEEYFSIEDRLEELFRSGDDIHTFRMDDEEWEEDFLCLYEYLVAR